MAGNEEYLEVIVRNLGSSSEECMNTSINFAHKNLYKMFMLTVANMAIVRSLCVMWHEFNVI